MEQSLLKSYLETLEELIIDENKIVTYKSLSKSLGIHVNTSKQLLYTFLLQCKDKNSNICATHLLAGKLNDGSLNVTIVNENEKENEKKKFLEITSDHIYSVQKGKALKEIKILAGVANNLGNKESNYVIKCSDCSKNNENEFHTSEKSNSKFFEESPSTVNTNVKCSNNAVVNSPNSKKINNSPKSYGKNCLENSKKVSPNNKSKAAESKLNAANKQTGKIDSTNETHKPELVPTTIQKNDNSKIEKSKEKKQSNLNEQDLKKPDNNKCKNKENWKKKENIKRKRIQLFSDSEESDNDTEIVPDEKFEPEEKILVTEEKKDDNLLTQNKRKKRKIVDVTVMNDDETRKELTLTTDSEDEIEENTSKFSKTKNNSEAKTEGKSKDVTSAKVPKKQSSLLTFFKKKLIVKQENMSDIHIVDFLKSTI
ncbi:DNA polymerase subunit delta, putative [Pediculus humanus corporis]|uniref:DNA polymerase delta subunit 3 n=1 Tax=Pediculus humanus subsp. corporis TaxID=121224 RepID=E0VZ83_PEDHC|nr:DNA polymerase subunit delta, putative [Pediculus humanus corporis]EEB18689.1 DNA polymerase subunit delta, putative [Pediculus humanus corporis]